MLRKKAEEDAQLLANRISLLKLEEKKALKKIEETRKKAKEIMELKQRNLERERQRELLKKQKEEEDMRKYLHNRALKESTKQSAENSKNQLLQKLKNDVEIMKKTKRVILLTIQLLSFRILENRQA